jgi:hypothetical protein
VLSGAGHSSPATRTRYRSAKGSSASARRGCAAADSSTGRRLPVAERRRGIRIAAEAEAEEALRLVGQGDDQQARRGLEGERDEAGEDARRALVAPVVAERRVGDVLVGVELDRDVAAWRRESGGGAQLELELRRQRVGVRVERGQADPDAGADERGDAGEDADEAQHHAAARQRPEPGAQHGPCRADHADEAADRADAEEGEHAASALEIAHAAQAGDPQRHDAADEPADDGADDAGEQRSDVDHPRVARRAAQAGANASPPSILSTAPVV